MPKMDPYKKPMPDYMRYPSDDPAAAYTPEHEMTDEPEICPDCKGLGRLSRATPRWPSGKMCQTCGGTGELVEPEVPMGGMEDVVDPEASGVNCARCDDEGVVECPICAGDLEGCPRCEGEGLVPCNCEAAATAEPFAKNITPSHEPRGPFDPRVDNDAFLDNYKTHESFIREGEEKETCPVCGEEKCECKVNEAGAYESDLMEADDMCSCCKGPSEDCTCEPGCECGCKPVAESFGGARFSFDKFMDRIVESETRRGMTVIKDSPQRERQQRRQERPLGRIRYGVK